jgi:hypothetical protein
VLCVEPFDHVLHAGVREPAAVVVHEQWSARVLQGLGAVPFGSAFQVAVDQRLQRRLDWDRPLPLALALYLQSALAGGAGDAVQVELDALGGRHPWPIFPLWCYR